MNVLAIGAHPDDIELGCGASLMQHRLRGDRVSLLVMTAGERGPQDLAPRMREQERAARLLGASLFWGGFEDGAVPDGREAVDVVQSVATHVDAEVIYTHVSRDTHQDHRAVATASMAAARRRARILLYESPTTVAFAPTLFVDVEGFVDAKLQALRAHASQVLKNGLVDLEAVEAQARYRGFQARVHNAEAFEVHRFLWDQPIPAIAAAGLDLELQEASE